MGILTNGINGEVRGRTGSAVGVRGKGGVNYVRSLPVQSKKAKKKKLQHQHSSLGQMSSLLSQARKKIEIGFYNSKKKGQQMDLAMKYNLANAIVTIDDKTAIDFSAVKFSRGSRERVWSEELFFEAGCMLRGSWEIPEVFSRKLIGSDEATIIIYDADDDNVRIFSKKVKRSDLKFEGRLGAEFVGHTMHAWIFFVSPDGREVSDSDYLGSGVVIAEDQ